LRGMVDADAVVLRAENTLYRLSRFGLTQQIGLFRDMFALPSGEGNAGEGDTDAHPIFLPTTVSSQAFSFLVNTLFGRYDEHPALPDLLTGLENSLAWTIPTVRLYAIDHINRISKRDYIHPMILLSLGRRHGIPEWIGPSVKQLADMPLSSLSANQEVLSFMTMDIHLVIARLREKLQTKRLYLALRAPDVFHTKECTDNKACSNAWDSMWLNTVGRKVLHPDLFRPTWLEVKACAENLLVPTMCRSCFSRVSSTVREINIWAIEEQIVQKAVDKLMVPVADIALPLNEAMEF